MKKKLLIAVSSFDKNNYYTHLLKKKFDIIKNKSGKKFNSNQLSNAIKNVEYIIAGTEIYDRDILAQASKLKHIYRLGVGLDNIDLDFCKKRNIKVSISKTNLTNAVVEHIIALMFASQKKIIYHNNLIKEGKWGKTLTSSVLNKKIGIIGFGRIGQGLYKFLKLFDADFFYYDLIKSQNKKIKFKSIRFIFKTCDIISLNLSSSKKSINLINGKLFKIAKKNLLLINTSRGSLINESHLYNFLKKNNTANACLDVFQKEPYNGNLKKLHNIILTPHISSFSQETRIKMEKDAFQQISKIKFKLN